MRACCGCSDLLLSKLRRERQHHVGCPCGVFSVASVPTSQVRWSMDRLHPLECHSCSSWNASSLPEASLSCVGPTYPYTRANQIWVSQEPQEEFLWTLLSRCLSLFRCKELEQRPWTILSSLSCMLFPYVLSTSSA